MPIIDLCDVELHLVLFVETSSQRTQSASGDSEHSPNSDLRDAAVSQDCIFKSDAEGEQEKILSSN